MTSAASTEDGDETNKGEACWPSHIQDKLKSLEEELEEGELTLKGFWKRKWVLVEQLMTKDQLKSVAELKRSLEEGNMQEKDYYAQLDSLFSSMKDPEQNKKQGQDDQEPSSSVKPVRVNVQKMKLQSLTETEFVSSSLSQSEPGPSGSAKGVSTSGGSRPRSQKSILEMFKAAPTAKKRAISPVNNREAKKLKEEEETNNTDKPDIKVKKEPPMSRKRCNVCSQLLESPNTVKYGGHPHAAREEFEAITEPSINLEGGMEEDTPQYKLTGFTVYDKAGHIVPFDTDLIETDKEIYFSGHLKNLLSEDPSTEVDSVPVKDCGPLSAWWTSGFDGGENVVVSMSSAFASYDLMEASEAYEPFYKPVLEKSFLAKKTIEYLVKRQDEGFGEEDELEDFLNYLDTVVPPRGLAPLDQEMVIRHAEFLVNQVFSYNEAGEEGEDFDLTKTPVMKDIIKLAGVQRAAIRRVRPLVLGEKKKKVEKIQFSSATVTPLVRSVFEHVFADQMENDDKANKQARKRKCGVCEQCTAPDCGDCACCKDMPKFGGTGKSKQSCKRRQCPNMTGMKEAEVSEEEEGEEEKENIRDRANRPGKETGKKVGGKEKMGKSVRNMLKVDYEWLGEGETFGKKTFYSGVILSVGKVEVGESVLLQPEDSTQPLYVGRVAYFYEDNKGGANVHIKWFGRATDTVLGNTGDPTELFILDSCEDQPLMSIYRKAVVEMEPEPDQEEWRQRGGSEPEKERQESMDRFWCSFYYSEEGRFEYPRPEPACAVDGYAKFSFCSNCVVAKEKEERFLPRVLERTEEKIITRIWWDQAELKAGDCIYLIPDSVKLKAKPSKVKPEIRDRKNVDESVYPEYYRKSDHVKGNNYTTPDPFQVAVVKGFKQALDSSLLVEVQMFYRPENTHKGTSLAEQVDLNLLYWSEEMGTVAFSQIEGRCHVRFADIDTSSSELDVWAGEGPDRWYFRDAYYATEKLFEEPPNSAKRIGTNKNRSGGKDAVGKGGKGKSSVKIGEGSSAAAASSDEDGPPQHPDLGGRRLQTLDVFAGCGGLSQGLHEAGVAEARWAVEVFEPAADAYKLNNPECTVFKDCCNRLLKNAMDGIFTNGKGQQIPKRGEVELLCGGPPCQGFSGMNRFNTKEYSQFKNSLVSSYLSYCEYYRPKYFILENVRNFASYKKSMVLKLCLTSLVRMGYQCTFGILQAGQFGVAQTRRRAILLAAAPGEVLPRYPEPRHVFAPQACHLSVEVDSLRYNPQTRWVQHAPYRTITVRDTMSDLPPIQNGSCKDRTAYMKDPESHFQRTIRNGSQVLMDHITKPMAPLVEKRFQLIPTTPGSDWRDLPNTIVELSDGTKTKKLLYLFKDAKNGGGPNGEERGVCPCADNKSKCDAKEKQQNTLIPWCLPHTSNRHNNWAGLYGRVEWDGFFSTTITNPEPMGKQGRVLHPDQHRLVSVRECARSQGFPDTYKFHGSVLDKHRQVGNAVPPPMGKVLGLEIRRAMKEAEKKKRISMLKK